MRQIVFVCTGNTCRSPMAEYILKEKLVGRGLADQIGCSSCGVAPCEGEPMARHAKQVLREQGNSFAEQFEAHLARLPRPHELDEAERIVCMSHAHQSILAGAEPSLAKKCVVLGHGVPDPYGRELDAYRACAQSIDQGLETLLRELIGQ